MVPVRVIADDEGLRPFETDAFIAHRETPMLAVLPDNEGQIREVVKACRALGVPVVSRVQDVHRRHRLGHRSLGGGSS